MIDSSGTVGGPYSNLLTPGGRLTMVSGTPVTTPDIHSGTSLWYVPFEHDLLPLWDGNKIVPIEFDATPVTIAGLSGTSSFDVFAYLSAGTAAFETSMWTTPTSRAIPLAYNRGKLVKSTDFTRLYLGSFYTSSEGKTDDSGVKRNVWNYYNQKVRHGYRAESTSHAYTTGTWRSWNNDATVRVEAIVGVIENAIPMSVYNDSKELITGVGIDVTNNPSILLGWNNLNEENRFSSFVHYVPTAGFHFYQVSEFGSTNGNGYAISISMGILG